MPAFDNVVTNLERLSRLQCGALNLIGLCAIPLICINVTADVFGRYFFNHPIPGALDISELLLVVVVCFALGYTARVRGHMSVEIATARLSEKAQAALGILMGLIYLPVIFLLTYFAALDGINTYKSGLETSVLHMPIYPFRFVVAVGFFALSMELFCQWLRSMERLAARKRLPARNAGS